jgi:hypothetical protein
MRQVDKASFNDSSEEVAPDEEFEPDAIKCLQIEVRPEKCPQCRDLCMGDSLECLIQAVEYEPDRVPGFIQDFVQERQSAIMLDEAGLLLAGRAELNGLGAS